MTTTINRLRVRGVQTATPTQRSCPGDSAGADRFPSAGYAARRHPHRALVGRSSTRALRGLPAPCGLIHSGKKRPPRPWIVYTAGLCGLPWGRRRTGLRPFALSMRLNCWPVWRWTLAAAGQSSAGGGRPIGDVGEAWPGPSCRRCCWKHPARRRPCCILPGSAPTGWRGVHCLSAGEARQVLQAVCIAFDLAPPDLSPVVIEPQTGSDHGSSYRQWLTLRHPGSLGWPAQTALDRAGKSLPVRSGAGLDARASARTVGFVSASRRALVAVAAGASRPLRAAA